MLQVSAAVLLKGFIMIKLTDVKKRFGDLEVLKGISITINDGEIYGIIGQSGAGKSTLLRCINGLESYDGGTITVDNELVSIADQQKLHLMQKKMGMIFQNFNLLNRLNVYDNVALPMKFWGMKTKTPEAKEKILGLLRLVGLEDKVEFLTEIPHAEIPKFYNSLDVYVHPSVNEAFCCALIEAQACGLPIICCKGISVEEVMTEESQRKFLVEPYSPQEIAKCILAVRDGGHVTHFSFDLDIDALTKSYLEWVEV